MSYKPEVEVDGQWSANSLRFATREEAAAYAHDLFNRWTITVGHRAVLSADPVNYRRLADGRIEAIPNDADADAWTTERQEA